MASNGPEPLGEAFCRFEVAVYGLVSSRLPFESQALQSGSPLGAIRDVATSW